ncbi:MAG TPA: MMPL family transporter, partial [Solirubrobacteraceae bacterium]|nr:MMPL family transporter [Solirubrobacteraceae bacterium]
MQSRNLASRAARWSAGHRKTAIFGWLAFVVISFVLAGAVGGQKTIADEDYGNGSSKVADKAIAKADFRDSAEEQVLVQGKGSVKATSAEFKSAVNDTVTRLERTKGVDKIESPYANGNEGQLSKDGRSALITFEIPGDDNVTEDRVDSVLATTAAAQKANPQVFIGQFGDASADKAISKAFEDDFKKAEVLS